LVVYDCLNFNLLIIYLSILYDLHHYRQNWAGYHRESSHLPYGLAARSDQQARSSTTAKS
jgi:hypothetical protein